MDNLQNKVAVITGGATGIGLALAKALGQKGASIVIGEPRENRLQEAVNELEALGITAKYFVCDVTDITQVEALADFAWESFDHVDLVFNNAGIGQPYRGPVVDTPLEAMEAVIDVNFKGVWYGCRVFGKRLIEQGTPAAIYNTGSENSFFVAVEGSAGYVASKHAVYGLTDALRGEMPDYITVGMITPGFVGSELIPEPARAMGMSTEEFAEIAVKQIQAGEFYVVSHSYNQVHIDQRYQDVSKAYASYAPRQDGDERYDVGFIMSQMSSRE